MAETRSSFGDDVRPPEQSAGAEPRRGFSFSLPFARGAARETSVPLFKGDALASLYSVGAAENREVSFGFLLRQSAHAIERGRALIEARGAAIARVVAARGAVEASLAGWGARLFIALFWVFIGIVLAREAGAGVGARGLDAQNAAMLSRIFVAAGVLGAVAAFVGGYLARAAEKSISIAENFGAEAGRLMREFAEAVSVLKARIGDHETPADISRLHLIAVEAAAFLEGIAFLTEPDHQRAEERFKSFLGQRAPASGGAGGGVLLLLLGVLIGAVAVAGGLPRLSASGLPLWVIAALPGLALLYALLGPLFAAVAGPASGTAAARARHDMLTALRRAYVEAGAPKAGDLLAEVEAALGGARQRESRLAAPDSRSNESDFAWRRPIEGPRFVAQSFEAAPPIFRADAQAGFGKNIFAGGKRNADPKQSASAPDAPRKLKD